jgi:alpha-L-rhamnosidase
VGITAPVNLFYSQALKVAAELARLAGDITQADALDARVERLRSAFDALFWDETHGVWVNLVQDGAQQPQASQQANSLALLYGIGSEQHRASALSHLLSDEALTQIGSPYFSYYLLAALFRYGRHEDALAYIRKHWGRMLDAGATTWWEEYHGETSRCHAWSIGPTIDLMAQYLGITPSSPGFASVQIAPHPGDLRWAKGIVPTPLGDVSVNWQRTDTGFVLNVSSPTSLTLEITVPAGPKDSVILNGQPLGDDQIQERTATTVVLRPMTGGGYSVSAVAAG